ncbi:MAG: hypothetical protein NXI04_05085 [Planctomycetaceae bacterium]|nr:hypothetical protein [Planctomycetaceae bacterium]
MFRLLLSALGPALLLSFVGTALAQSGSRGGGSPINSRPIQNAPSQPYRGTVQPGLQTQGSGTSRQGGSQFRQSVPGSQGSGTVVKETFESKFWKYLINSRYKNWSPVPGRTGDTYAGESPHGAMLKMYLNRTAAGRPSELPDRSIVVKENYAADGRTLMAVTVMYRTRGYNREGGDWYWIKYRPDGSVDEKVGDGTRLRLAGKPQGCIECHSGADGGDFAFFNDGL